MTHAMPERRQERFQRLRKDASVWIIDHVPLPLLTNAHEVGISVALALVAFPFVMGTVPGPESVHSQVPFVLARTWAWSLLLSAGLTIWGLFANRPRMEWAGQLFAGYALTFYAGAIAWGNGMNGFLACSIFGVLGAVSFWRSYKITHAPLIQQRLTREARHAHETFHAIQVRQGRRNGYENGGPR